MVISGLGALVIPRLKDGVWDSMSPFSSCSVRQEELSGRLEVWELFWPK